MKIFLLLSILTLTACSNIQQKSPSPASPWLDYQKKMRQTQQWLIIGKAAFRSNSQRESASYSWQQKDDRFDIQLFGPLNQLAAQIKGNNEFVELNIDGKQFYERSPEQLLEKNLGWHLPIRNIQWWIRGISNPLIPSTSKFSDHRLKELHQDSWHIQYLRYSAGKNHPEKIKLTRDEFQVTLIVKQWGPS